MISLLNNSRKPSIKIDLNIEGLKRSVHGLDKTRQTEFEVLDGSMADYPEVRSLNLSPKINERLFTFFKSNNVLV